MNANFLIGADNAPDRRAAHGASCRCAVVVLNNPPAGRDGATRALDFLGKLLAQGVAAIIFSQHFHHLGVLVVDTQGTARQTPRAAREVMRNGMAQAALKRMPLSTKRSTYSIGVDLLPAAP